MDNLLSLTASVLNNIHSTAAKLETLKADVKGKVSVLQSVTLCPEKRRRPIPDAELPQAKHTCIENVLPVPAPPSTSDPVPTTTQVTPPTDSQSQLPSTSAAVEPAVQEPSPHIQVYRSLNYCQGFIQRGGCPGISPPQGPVSPPPKNFISQCHNESN